MLLHRAVDSILGSSQLDGSLGADAYQNTMAQDLKKDTEKPLFYILLGSKYFPYAGCFLTFLEGCQQLWSLQ